MEKSTRALYFMGAADASCKGAMVDAGIVQLALQCMREHRRSRNVVSHAAGVVSMLLESDAAAQLRGRRSLPPILPPFARLYLCAAVPPSCIRRAGATANA